MVRIADAILWIPRWSSAGDGLYRTVPEMHLLRTKPVVSSLRNTSDRKMYGASAVRIRLGYVVHINKKTFVYYG